MPKHMVIIGNGVAGFSAARRLRREAPDVTISIFSDEAHPFYMRGRLKEFIAGAVGEYEMILESRNLYRRERLNLFLQTPVSGLDTANHEVILPSGERVGYDRLLLATGSAPTTPEMPGGQLTGVFGLRTLADAQAIRQWAGTHHRAVVLGEGAVSLQLAESLARLGVQVDHTLLGEQLWPDVLDPTTGTIFEETLRELGVRFRKRVRVARVVGTADGAVSGAELEDGTVLPCEMLAHGCGYRPNTAMLAGTPVRCDEGIVVNDFLETSAPDVFAAGDVLSLELGNTGAGPHSGQRWRNAFRLGETAALNMLGNRMAVDSFGVSLRVELGGLHAAVIGRANLSEVEPEVTVERVQKGDTYRRLVFRDDVLVGAILVGDTSHATLLEDRVRSGSLRSEIEASLLPALVSDEMRLTEPLTARCPICTDTVELPAGALVGSHFACRSCGAQLALAVVRGRLGIVPAEQ